MMSNGFNTSLNGSDGGSQSLIAKQKYGCKGNDNFDL